MKTSIPRLRRVRFKDGRTIEVLRQPPKSRAVQKGLEQSVSRALESCVGDNMVGFALVCWAETGEVYVNYSNGDKSLVSGGMVPQYVKDILIAEQAARWANE